MTEKIIAFIRRCPMVSDYTLTEEKLLGRAKEICIQGVTCEPRLSRYTDGGGLRQFVFQVFSRDTSDQKIGEFFQGLAEWLEQQKENLPDFGKEKTVQRIEVTESGGLENMGYTHNLYGIRCRVIYYQKGA